MTGTEQNALALDIKTIAPALAPGKQPRFRNSSDFEIFAVNAALRDDSGDISTRTFFRDASGPTSELSLIETAMEWCTAQNPSVVYSYNGESVGFVQLARRPELAAAEAGVSETATERVEEFLRTTRSIDLKKSVWSRFGRVLKFDEAVYEATGRPVPATRWRAYDHGFDIEGARETAGLDPTSPELQATDIPLLGNHYLSRCDAGEGSSNEFAELQAMLRDYCTTTLSCQFELAAEFA
ncbi:hypothetical protein ACFQH3_07275 [Haladaptatus sp. GCM10025707]|uniref:hypothetical protein n=1 Tax=unclassified Haladaptatus TaxID=2622732 RepID=UPI0023E80B6A|nr:MULTISPECIES: hypothetical protein [unclassified Haladaptatus]